MNVETQRPELGDRLTNELQWGHVQVNVETQGGSAHWHMIEAASMGPRSGERGNADLAREWGISKVLQWGHVQVNVETICFWSLIAILIIASMGPRSGERGNTVDGDD